MEQDEVFDVCVVCEIFNVLKRCRLGSLLMGMKWYTDRLKSMFVTCLQITDCTEAFNSDCDFDCMSLYSNNKKIQKVKTDTVIMDLQQCAHMI